MSRSSFSKAYEEIANFKPIEMTFTIEDADLDKLHDVLKDINVKECPWFEVQDKHGNKARYYREPHWIPCTPETMPKEKGEYLVTFHPCYWDNVQQDIKVGIDSFRGKTSWAKKKHQRVIAWCELPAPYQPKEDES